MTNCELCGNELDFKAKFGSPKHIFNLPTKTGYKQVCRDCFNKGMAKKK